MTVCVTGGSGFIGGHISRALESAGHDVVIVDRQTPASGARFVMLDISKAPLVGIEAHTIFHFAASPDVRQSMSNPAETIENNFIATHNVLEACRRLDVKKIIFASTSAVYGNADTAPTPEHAEIRPVSVYGATKAASEALIRAYHESYGMDATILRYANIYGPGSRCGVMHDFVRKLQKNPEELEILGDGMQSKSYLYIDDAVEATMLAAREKGWRIFNIGSETQTTVTEIARLVTGSMGLGAARFRFTGGTAGWAGDIPRFLLDVSKIKSLGWREKTGLAEGVRSYVDWVTRL